MANPKNKQELLDAITDGYAKLCDQIAKMSDVEKVAPFDFAADPKKCGVRWQYDRCLRDPSVRAIRGIICPMSTVATTTRWTRCWSRSIKAPHWQMPNAS